MKNIILTLLCLIPLLVQSQEESKIKTTIKKQFKFATFYTAVTGNNSLADIDTYTLLPDGSLRYGQSSTPFDYTIAFGVRKIARLGYENRKNVFYNGTESSVSDAATVGRVKGLEFLFESDYKRQQGNYFVDQQHFLRYVHTHWIIKAEYVQDGFADLKYFESSQRYRLNVNKKLSFNAGIVQRFSEPYGFDPLSDLRGPDFVLLALDEGYNTDGEQWFDPGNNLVSESNEVFNAVVLPRVLSDYVRGQRELLPNQWNYSFILGYDYYHYTKDLWFHSWASVLPYHASTNNQYSYINFIEGNQWIDYTAGLIFGSKINKSFGIFLEGKYHKYWNRNWHDFSVGFNYVII